MADKSETTKYKGYDIVMRVVTVKGETTAIYTPYRPDRGGPLKQHPTLEEAQLAVDADNKRRRGSQPQP